jgi:chromosome partitioning protein
VTGVDGEADRKARRRPLVERAAERLEPADWSFAAFDDVGPRDGPAARQPPASGPGPRVILLGSEKGGTGKSTTAMHLLVALLKFGYAVGAIDLDSRQGTLSRYLANRRATAARGGRDLPMPLHRRVESSGAMNQAGRDAEERRRFESALEDVADCDFVVIDAPGSDTHLARLAHLHADVLVTPLNDSLVDVDVLAEIDPETRAVLAPGVYTKLIRRQNDRRAGLGRPPLKWVVLRNRLTHIGDRNKVEVAELLALLAERFGFDLVPGFGERVVFRQLFRDGRTLLDAPDAALEGAARPSHLSAYWEILTLLGAVGFFGQAPAAAPREASPVARPRRRLRGARP